ncbi:MAG: T9SS type A sorting domain-containing protein [Bacteroidetes bacterium]|nr:T9SS type A sorting domain-containing protein [Bacteroidota bacterium]
MKKQLLAAFICANVALSAQTQMVRWANTMGGNNPAPIAAEDPTKGKADAIKSIVEDGYSNTYVIGNFTGTFILQVYTPTAGSGLASGAGSPKTITSNGDQDVFLARYDRDGKCTWATSIGGTGYDEGNSICFNGSPAAPTEFYITGKFDVSMNIAANTLYSTNGFTDAFVIKYTAGLAVTPVASWWKNFGGGSETNGLGIAANSSSVFITGYYTEWIDNPITLNIHMQKTMLNGSTTGFTTPTPGYLEFPSRDMFVARFSSAGVFSDAVSSYRSDEQIESHAICLRGSDIYITGTYKGNIKLNSSSTIPCSGISDIFVAKYPSAFSTSSGMPFATSAVTAGGNSTLYQSAVGNLPYRPDGAFAIASTNDGVFVTGRFLNSATFGSTTVDPQASDFGVSYMFLARYDLNLTNTPSLYTGTENQSEGYGLYPVYSGGISTLFVTGLAQSNSKINGVLVRNNVFAPEYSGFVTRIAYNSAISNFDVSNTGNFTDGITQNLGGADGTGGAGLDFNVNSRGYAVSYRVGCGVRIGGAFNAKTYFGNIMNTVSGKNDGFLSIRENAATISSNLNSCGPAAVTFFGTGTAPFLWTNTGGTTLGTSSSLNVTPVANSFTTVIFSTSGVGGCPPSTSPVTLFNYPLASTGSAGPDKIICTNLGQTSTTIGSGLLGATFSWALTTGLSSPTAATPLATPPATSTNYTVTITDKCGNVSTDVVNVLKKNDCPRSLTTQINSIEADASSLSIYPNPNNGKFDLTVDADYEKNIIVYDYTGKIVFEKNKISDRSINIDITNVAKGIYFVKIISDNQTVTKKIIKE